MILGKLKNTTSSVHNDLENKNKLLSKLVSEELSLKDYVSILKKFYGFFLPLEHKISTHGEIKKIIPDFSSRRRVDSIKNDIYFFEDIDIDTQVPLCKDQPVLENHFHALGCFYVLEGSSLGGKIIYKNLEKNLKLNFNEGASFFFGYGHQTGKMWKSFQNHYNNLILSNEDENFVLNAAKDTFLKLDSWFDAQI